MLTAPDPSYAGVVPTGDPRPEARLPGPGMQADAHETRREMRTYGRRSAHRQNDCGLRPKADS